MCVGWRGEEPLKKFGCGVHTSAQHTHQQGRFQGHQKYFAYIGHQQLFKYISRGRQQLFRPLGVLGVCVLCCPRHHTPPVALFSRYYCKPK